MSIRHYLISHAKNIKRGGTKFFMEKKEKEKMENLASEQKFYTYEDYLKINDGNRYEIIHGRLYLKDEWGDMRTNTSKIEKVKMLAAPSVLHQEIVLEIGAQLKEKLKGKKCKTFVSPIDVILNEENVVQPDIAVVCNDDIITKKGIKGAPKVVIEVLSKGSIKNDKIAKYSLYMEYGVEEYIIVNPINKEIIECKLNSFGFYDTKKLNITDDIILPECTISLKDFYEQNPEYLK